MITLPSSEVVDIVLAEKSLAEFTAQAWNIVEPHGKYIASWYIEAVCEHLEAVYNEEIQNLIINIPPRHGKSLVACVFFPSWSWIQKPYLKFIFSSYASSLSIRDSIRSRRVIQSPWYQERWGSRFVLNEDQNQKVRFENNQSGYRLATSVGGANTGEGGNIIVVDDPHNVMEAESDSIRESCNMWWDEVMSTRINDPKKDSRIIICHRTHENDLSGHVLAGDVNYFHLCLPARYSNKSKCTLSIKDLRKEGEPLCESRFGDEELKILEKSMTEYAVHSQLQQDPKPRSGSLFRVDRVKVIKSYNVNEVSSMVRYWDKGSDEGCYTAGVLMIMMKDKSFIIKDVVRGRWTVGERERTIRQTAENDGEKVRVWVEQEPGSGGKESGQNTIRNLSGFNATLDKVQGSKKKPMDKITRATPFAVQVEIGNVSVVNGEWVPIYFNEMRAFPNSTFKDQMDASSGAFNKLVGTKPRSGRWGRKKK